MLVADGAACTFTEWAKTGTIPCPETVLDEAGRAADYILTTYPTLLS